MKYLILGPGALAFYTLLGYMVKNHEMLEEVEEISGASSGALLGFLLLSNKTPKEIFDLTINMDLKEIIKVDLKSFISSFGFIGHDLIKEKMKEVWGGNPTFKELPKKFYVSAFCINTLEVEYFSSDTHPDMHVVDAVCASISIPMMFSTYEYNGKKYVDGAMNEVMPVLPFLNKNFNDVLLLHIDMNVKMPVDLTNLFSYLRCVFLAGMKNRHMYPVPIIRFDVSHINIIDLYGPIEDRLRLFMIGYTK